MKIEKKIEEYWIKFIKFYCIVIRLSQYNSTFVRIEDNFDDNDDYSTDDTANDKNQSWEEFL